MTTEGASALGDRLRAGRLAAGLSVRRVAGIVSIHHGYLARLENGEQTNPSADVLQRLAEALQLDASELLSFIGVKPASGLPDLRTYLMRKYELSAERAETIARLVEQAIEQEAET